MKKIAALVAQMFTDKCAVVVDRGYDSEAGIGNIGCMIAYILGKAGFISP